MCKKSTKNDKSSTLGRPWALYGATFGRVGGRGGRPGNLVLLVLGQTLAGDSTRLAPPSKDGVGGFKGYRLCRRPLLNQVLAILCDL